MAFDLYAAQGVIDAANSTVTSTVSALGAGADAAARQVESATARLVSILSTTAQNATAQGQAIIKQSVDTATQFVTAARGAVVQLGLAIVGGLGQVRAVVISALTSAAGAAASMAATVGQRVAGFIAGLVPSLVSGLGSAIGAAQSALSGLLAPISALASLTPTSLAIVAGLASTISAAVVGATIILKRTLSPFVTSMTFWGGIGSALLTGFKAAFSVASGIGGVIRSGVTLVSGALKTAFVTVSGWIKTAWGWAQSAGSFVAANIGSVVSGVASLASTALKAGVALGQVTVAGTALAVFSTLVYAAGQSAMDFARSARDLSGVTGFGLGKSASLLDRLGIQGIGAGSVQSIYANSSPFAVNMKARAFGLSAPDSPGFLASLSQRFQSLNSSGPLGNAMAQALVKSLGLNSEVVRAAQTSPATQQANSNFQRQIDSNLGLSPAALKGYAEAIPASLQRISYGLQKSLLFLAGETLPIVEQITGYITKTIGAQSGNIASFIQNAVRFMFVKVVPMFAEGLSTLTSMVASGVTNLLKWGLWIRDKFPAILSALAQTTADTLRSWSQSFSVWAPKMIDAFANWLLSVGDVSAKALTGVTNYISDVMMNFAQFIYNIWSNNNGPLQAVGERITGFFDAVANTSRNWAIAVTQTIANVNNALVKLAPKAAALVGLSPISQQQVMSAATGGFGPSTLQADFRRYMAGPALPRFADAWAQNSANTRQWGADRAASLRSGFGDIAESARRNGKDIAARLSGAGVDLGNFIATPDGRRNIGRDAGNAAADLVAPAVNLFSRMEPVVNDLADAAQGWRRSVGTERERSLQYELLQETRRGNALRERGNQLISDLHQQVKGGGRGALDRVAGMVLSEFARETSAAVLRRV